MKKDTKETQLRLAQRPMSVTPTNKIILLGCVLVALLMVLPAKAAVTVQGWWHYGEVSDFFADSSGNSRRFQSAFSCVGGGNAGAAIVPLGVGGPLGTTGFTSQNSLYWTPLHCGAAAMWNPWAGGVEWNPPPTNYVIECWILPEDIASSPGRTWFFASGSGDFSQPSRPARTGAGGVYFAWDKTAGTGGAPGIGAFVIGNASQGVPADTQIGDFADADYTKWMHVAIVNTDGTNTFYVNGVPVGASTITNTIPNGNIFAGGSPGTQPSFHGWMDELRISTFAPGQFSTTDLLLRTPGPNIVSQPESTTAWEGGTAPFRVITAYDTSTTYQWRSNGVSITGATGNLYVQPNLTLGDSGTSNQVVATASSISTTSSVATVTVVQNNPADVAAYRDLVQNAPTLLAYFPADNNSGSTLTNVEDATHNGTLELGAIYDGRTNRAFGQRTVSFYGDGDVQIPNNPAFEFPSGNGTIEALIYLDPTALGSLTAGTIFSQTADGGTPNYYFLRASANGNSIIYGNDVPTELSWDVPGGLIGKRTYVAVVFNSTTNVTLYANGQNLGTKTQTSFGAGTGAPSWIGSMGTSATANWLYGSVDELAIYSSALSENSIQLHYSGYFFGTNTAPPSIVSQSSSRTLYAGGSPVLNATVAGTLPLTYGWHANGVPIPGANSSTLALSNATVTTTYSLAVTNAYGTTNSQPIVLTFLTPPTGYAAAVMQDAPTAFWRLSETAGTTAVDVAGYNDGSYSGSLTLGTAGLIQGDSDTAVTFAPTSKSSAPYSPTLNNPVGPFSIEFWAKPGSVGTQCAISSQNRTGSRAGLTIFQNNGGSGWSALVGNDAQATVFVNGGTTVQAGVTYHVVVTYDLTDFRVYVNGIMDASAAIAFDTGFDPNKVAPFQIGARNNGDGFPFVGVIDDVAVYNYALPANRITNHWSFSWFAASITQSPANTNTTELSTIALTAAASGYPNTYQWYKDSVALDGTKTNFDGTLHYPGGVTSPTLTIAKATIADAGQYHLMVINPVAGAQTTDATVGVTADTTPPVAQTAASMDITTVDICFDEFLDPGGFDPGADPGTARNAANYTFVSPGGATVTSAELRKNGKAVRLTVTGLSPGTAFTIKVANVIDWSRRPANAIPAAGQNVSGTVQTQLTTALDIATTVAGATYSCKPGEFEVEAGGVDIWGASDTFHFAYKEVTGDFDVRVQIAEVTNPGNRSGIMLRESTAADSRFNYVTWNPGANGQLGFHVRETDATTPVWKNPENNWLGGFPAPNVWMRLKREGDLTSAFRSTDGINWIAFGTTTNVIANPALLGLATAANAGANTGYTRYASYGATPGILNISGSGGVLTLSWSGPGVLKSSASVTGPYTPESSQSNPQVVLPTGTSKFFRLE